MYTTDYTTYSAVIYSELRRARPEAGSKRAFCSLSASASSLRPNDQKIGVRRPAMSDRQLFTSSVLVAHVYSTADCREQHCARQIRRRRAAPPHSAAPRRAAPASARSHSSLIASHRIRHVTRPLLLPPPLRSLRESQAARRGAASDREAADRPLPTLPLALTLCAHPPPAAATVPLPLPLPERLASVAIT